MSADEKAIIDYLTAWTNSFVSGTEIAKRLDKRRFKEDRLWAMPILSEMVRQGYLDTDAFGHFRIKQEEEEEEEPEQRHVSPQILKILKSSGKKFDNIVPDDDKGTSSIPPYRGPAKSPAPNETTDG